MRVKKVTDRFGKWLRLCTVIGIDVDHILMDINLEDNGSAKAFNHTQIRNICSWTRMSHIVLLLKKCTIHFHVR